MSGARREILDRVRTANARAGAAPPRPPNARSPRPVRETPADAGALLATYLEDVGVVVERCRPERVADAVAGLCGRFGATDVVVAPGLPTDWTPAGARTWSPGAPPAGLDDPGCVAVTGCALAVAETGTLVLDHGDDQGPRALTLVPDAHVCVVSAGAIVATIADAFAALAPAAAAGRPLTFVTGPSATSDIEMQRVSGVHGPRRLGVVLAA